MLSSRLFLSRRFYAKAAGFQPPRFGRHDKSPLPPIGSVPDFHSQPAYVRELLKHPKIYPWPAEPRSGKTNRDPRMVSDTWLNTRPNDGTGDRAVNLMNFHWRVENAMDLDALNEFRQHIQRMDQGEHWVAAIFRAPDGYDFCPGADLVKLGQGDLEYNKQFFKAAHEAVYTLATMRTPAFPVIQGHTMGLGAGLTMHSLFRVVAEDAVWSMPNVLYGAFPDMGSSFVLPRLEGEYGMFLALTGKRLENTDIVRVGLGTHYVPIERIKRFEQETSRVTEENTKEDLIIMFNLQTKPIPNETAIGLHQDAINRCFSKNTLAEIFEALEKENTDWSKGVLERLRLASPLMLHVTFRLQRMGRYLNTLEEALQLEYRIAQHMIKSDDFYEGIKARVVEEREPNWKYSSVGEVPTEVIAKFFEPTADELELVACHRSLRPNPDPYRIYRDEVEAFIAHPTYEYLVQRQLDKLIPRELQTTQNIKEFYKKIFKEGGMAEEGAAFYYKATLMEGMNPDPVDMANFMKRKSLEQIQREEDEALERARRGSYK